MIRQHHNTTNESGPELDLLMQAAQTQDARVLAYFEANPNRWLTCESVSRDVLPAAPLTSARRAVSNLHRAGKITKGDKVKGQYGRNIYYWSLAA